MVTIRHVGSKSTDKGRGKGGIQWKAVGDKRWTLT